MTATNMPASRYILPSFDEKTSWGRKTQDPYGKLFENRTVFLGAQIDEVSSNDVVAQLLVLDSISDEDITLYINSPGGDTIAALAIYDTINLIKPDVRTVCIGRAESAAALILASGAKGKRGALPSARILLHQNEEEMRRGQASDIRIMSDEAQRLRAWIESIYADVTGQEPATITEALNRTNYLTAEKAKAFGIIDDTIKRS